MKYTSDYINLFSPNSTSQMKVCSETLVEKCTNNIICLNFIVLDNKALSKSHYIYEVHNILRDYAEDYVFMFHYYTLVIHD